MFPNEIVCQIIKQVPFEDQLNLRLVNYQWKDCCDYVNRDSDEYNERQIDAFNELLDNEDLDYIYYFYTIDEKIKFCNSYHPTSFHGLAKKINETMNYFRKRLDIADGKDSESEQVKDLFNFMGIIQPIIQHDWLTVKELKEDKLSETPPSLFFWF